VPESNGTTTRASGRGHCTSRGSQHIHGIDPGKCAGLISDDIVAQTIEALKEKTTQAQTQAAELKEKLQKITKEIKKLRKVRWLRRSHMSVLGSCWK
jgi:hypothetical protein